MSDDPGPFSWSRLAVSFLVTVGVGGGLILIFQYLGGLTK